MGRFEQNDMNLEIKVFNESDPCTFEMKMCGNLTNMELLSFNAALSAKVADVIAGSSQIRGAEVKSTETGETVMFVESDGSFERTGSEMMGIDISDLNSNEAFTMQMAMQGMELDDAYMKFVHSEDTETRNELTTFTNLAFDQAEAE